MTRTKNTARKNAPPKQPGVQKAVTNKRSTPGTGGIKKQTSIDLAPRLCVKFVVIRKAPTFLL